MIRLFVTGTDTGVGKTTVSCAILAAARRRGLRTLAAKPIESGCVPDQAGTLIAADAMALAHAADGLAPPLPPPGSVYRFRAALAPSVAAALEDRTVRLEPMLRACRRLESLAPDLLLVEGAGGLLVPLGSDLLVADLAAALRAPLLVVARDSLGTINHTLLTVESARRRQLPVAAVILSAPAPGTSSDDAATNAREIGRRADVPVLGRLPHQTDCSPDALAKAAEAHLDLDRILAAA